MNRHITFYSIISCCTIIVLIIVAITPNLQVKVAKIIDPKFTVRFTLPKNKNTPSLVETARVNKVIDGDTIVLDSGRTVRYLYIDTPETVKPNTPIECFGEASKKLNTTLVEGKKVKLYTDTTNKDSYGRDLRIVYLENVNSDSIENSINAQLVIRGYARTKVFSDNKTYKTEFEEFEKTAKKTRVGMWRECDYS